MRGTILQPGYFPWLGFFNQMWLSDVFVFLDDVQYDRRGWRNRNKVKSINGSIWLTVPVIQKGRFRQDLKDTLIDNSHQWAIKHIRTLEFNYRSAKFFECIFTEIESILTQGFEFLVDLDIAIIDAHRKWLGLEPIQIFRSSDIVVKDNDKTGRLVEICRSIGINEYISGPLCRNYLDINRFSEAGINVFLHEYKHPNYNQINGTFLPFLSTIDLIFNEGPQSLQILQSESALLPFSKYESGD